CHRSGVHEERCYFLAHLMVFTHGELPREPVLVLKPTVLPRPRPCLIWYEDFSAFDQFLPDSVDLGFTVEDREDRNRWIQIEDRPRHAGHEILSCERERNDVALARRRVGDGRYRVYLRVLEQRRIERGGLLCLLIKPEMRHDFLQTESSFFSLLARPVAIA